MLGRLRLSILSFGRILPHALRQSGHCSGDLFRCNMSNLPNLLIYSPYQAAQQPHVSYISNCCPTSTHCTLIYNYKKRTRQFSNLIAGQAWVKGPDEVNFKRHPGTNAVLGKLADFDSWPISPNERSCQNTCWENTFCCLAVAHGIFFCFVLKNSSLEPSKECAACTERWEANGVQELCHLRLHLCLFVEGKWFKVCKDSDSMMICVCVFCRMRTILGLEGAAWAGSFLWLSKQAVHPPRLGCWILAFSQVKSDKSEKSEWSWWVWKVIVAIWKMTDDDNLPSSLISLMSYVCVIL